MRADFSELPYDVQAESGVISTLIQNPEFILHSEYLKPNYFYLQENGCFYWAIEDLYKDGIDNIDAFNIMTKLNSNKGVKNTLDSLNVSSVQDFIDLSKNVARDTIEEYKILVNKVVALSFKRDLFKKLQYFETKCLDSNDTNLASINSIIYDDLNKLSEQYILDDSIKCFGEIIDDVWQDILNRQCGDKLYGIPSKFEILNSFCPFEKGELIVLAAPRKTGKSIFELNECWHKIQNGIPTAYLDTEMSTRSFTERLVAHITQIPVYKIKQGNYSKDEQAVINDAIKILKDKPFVHRYQPSWTNEQIYSTCKILQNRIGLELVLYDYLKGNSVSSSDQYNELGNKTNFLKNDIAGGLNLAVGAGAQLNRSNEMGDSYKIEQYASTILNLRPKTDEEIISDGKDCGNYALRIKLNRNGEQMNDENEYIDMLFNGNLATFTQAKQHSVIKPDILT